MSTECPVRRLAVTCLWRGADLPAYSACRYGMEDVVRLAKGLERHVPGVELLVLCSDDFREELLDRRGEGPIIPAPMKGWGGVGWERILKVFDTIPVFWCAGDDERVVLFDLDTIITGDCTWLWEWDKATVGLPLNSYPSKAAKGVPNKAIVTYTHQGARLVWQRYQELRRKGNFRKARQYQICGSPSEQKILEELYREHRWPPINDRRLVSYKHGYLQDPARLKDASLVYFHGDPKPSDLPPTHELRRIWEGAEART